MLHAPYIYVISTTASTLNGYGTARTLLASKPASGPG